MTDLQRNTDKCVKEFEKFYGLLMQNAPNGYAPWFFLLKKMGKDPATRGSWKDESARLTKEQAIGYIRQGYNIAIAARHEDSLILTDIDNKDFLDQAPKDTLIVTSRKRCGIHAFGWDKDHSAKINIPTDNGEVRADDQYLVACGSYVPFNMDSEKDKKAFDALPEEAREDRDFGYYTVKTELPPRLMTFDDLPNFFKQKAREDYENTARVKQTEERKEYSGAGGKYDTLFKLKASDVVGWPSRARSGHPLHDSDTDANFSMSTDGSLATCWRHMVSLNAVQLLCIEAGYANCEDAGTPHMGRGYSKIKGDKKALEIAYKLAIKKNLISEYVVPIIPKQETIEPIFIYVPKGREEDGTTRFETKVNPVGVAQHILHNGHYLTMRDNEEIYAYKDGIWEKDERIVKEMANKTVGKLLTTHNFTEILLHFKINSYFQRERMDANPNLIALENGVFNLETMKVEDFFPEHYLTVRIPITYNEVADCPKFKKFLSEVTDPDSIKLIQELFGYLIYKRYRYHRAFMLLGEGRNGKTTLINVMGAFVGPKNISAESLINLEANKFAIARLYGKLANLQADLPNTVLKHAGIFKSSTGEDPLSGENKFGHGFTFTNYAKMIFATNDPPEVTEDTLAFWERWIHIKFPNTFVGKDANTNLTNELTTKEELSGIFNWAIEGLKRLLENNGFSYNKTSKEVREYYLKLSASAKWFIDKFLVGDSDGSILKEDLLGKYLAFCKDNKLSPQSEKTLSQRLKENFPEVRSDNNGRNDKGARKWRWVGITFDADKGDVQGDQDVLDFPYLYPSLTQLSSQLPVKLLYRLYRMIIKKKIKVKSRDKRNAVQPEHPVQNQNVNNASIVEHEYDAKDNGG